MKFFNDMMTKYDPVLTKTDSLETKTPESSSVNKITLPSALHFGIPPKLIKPNYQNKN